MPNLSATLTQFTGGAMSLQVEFVAIAPAWGTVLSCTYTASKYFCYLSIEAWCADRPDAVDVFFHGKQKEVQVLTPLPSSSYHRSNTKVFTACPHFLGLAGRPVGGVAMVHRFM